MSRASTLDNAAIDLASLREDAKVQLLNILDEASAGSGDTCLVLDRSLAGPLNLVMVEGAKVLKAHGVKDFKELNWSELATSCEDVVYLVRPTIQNMKQIAAHMRDSGQGTRRRKKNQRGGAEKRVSVYFVPRRSFCASRCSRTRGCTVRWKATSTSIP